MSAFYDMCVMYNSKNLTLRNINKSCKNKVKDEFSVFKDDKLDEAMGTNGNFLCFLRNSFLVFRLGFEVEELSSDVTI